MGPDRSTEKLKTEYESIIAGLKNRIEQLEAANVKEGANASEIKILNEKLENQIAVK